jgi:hypothetical protein
MAFGLSSFTFTSTSAQVVGLGAKCGGGNPGDGHCGPRAGILLARLICRALYSPGVRTRPSLRVIRIGAAFTRESEGMPGWGGSFPKMVVSSSLLSSVTGIETTREGLVCEDTGPVDWGGGSWCFDRGDRNWCWGWGWGWGLSFDRRGRERVGRDS